MHRQGKKKCTAQQQENKVYMRRQMIMVIA